MKLRPHHIYCFHFLNFFDPSRGKEFEEARDKVGQLFQTEEDKIEVTEGTDPLCEACSYFNGEMCSHPRGDEKEVRKWDLRIVEELGVRFGEVMSVDKMKSLIQKKAPLTFCLTRCRYYRESRCNPFARKPDRAG